MSDERGRLFEDIAQEVFEPLRRYLSRRSSPADADDLLADVMLTVWRRFDDAPSGRELAWCYGIAKRVLANHRRSQSRHLRLVQRLAAEPRQEFTPDPADFGPDPELATALASLSERDRELLQLWAWEQLEPREIAFVLEISVNAATLRLGRAKKRLADSLAGQNSEGTGHKSGEGIQEPL